MDLEQHPHEQHVAFGNDSQETLQLIAPSFRLAYPLFPGMLACTNTMLLKLVHLRYLPGHAGICLQEQVNHLAVQAVRQQGTCFNLQGS